MMQIGNEMEIFTAEYSKIGENHSKRNIENQDRIFCGTVEPRVKYLVVSDGVSSAKHAAEGASIAVKTIQNLAEEVSQEMISVNDIKAVQSYVVKKWKEQIDSDWNEYATTVNFIIFDGQYLLVGQIGDGLICANVDGNTFVMGESEVFYSTETPALGEAVLRKDFRIKSLQVIEGFSIYIVTDGIGKEINRESYFPLERYLFELSYDKDRFLEEIISWIDELSSKNGDDKTLGYMSARDLK